MRQLTFAVALAFLLCLAASAGTIVINFETVPVEATGPSTFAAAGPMQTIVVPSVATITGGVILGNETNLPAQSFGTPPNVYATAGFGDPTLQSTLTIDLSASFPTTEVSFPVFNGSTQTESYVVDAFNGAAMVATQTLSSVPANGSSGFGIIDLMAANITSVTIAPVALDASCCDGWDFSIDSIALNESVQQALGTPEPGTFALLGLGLGIAAFAGARRRRKA
jgi:PEP-CTERM motif-containing protein